MDENNELNMWLGIFNADKPDSTDYVIRNRNREHMRQAVHQAFGRSREHLIDSFLNKAATIQPI